jgi:xeroderma pigmentosum group C-complementing protein
MTEAMPTTMAGFKGHPLYVLPSGLLFVTYTDASGRSYALARHLKRDEIIQPLTELGKFRGESVYSRSNVVPLKAAENWMRAGRKVKHGAQPLKWVKRNAVTLQKKRAVAVALETRRAHGTQEDGMGEEEGVLQGLYALDQTEVYRPPPVVDVSEYRS